jgi:bacillolysin
LKKYFLLLSLTTCILYSATAQFKTHRNPTSKAELPEYLQILNPLGDQISTSEEKLVTFNPRTIINTGQDLKNKINVIAYDENGLPIAIEGTLTESGNRTKPIQSRAMSHLRALSPIMGSKDAAQEFVYASMHSDELANHHIKFHQKWNDVPVYGAEIIVHTQNDEINFVNGRYFAKPESLNTKATITDGVAQQKAIADLKGLATISPKNLGLLGHKQVSTELVVYPLAENKFTLAYHHTIYKNLIDRWEYFVDAHTNEILHKHTSICKFHNHHSATGSIVESEKTAHVEDTPFHTEIEATETMMDGPVVSTAQDLFNTNRSINAYQVGSKFYMIDASRPMFSASKSVLPDEPEGSIWTIDAFNTSPQTDAFNYDHVVSTSNSWTHKTAVSAHYNGGKAYEYFKNMHTRNSINGSGGNIISFVNITDEDGKSMANAFWNGAAIFYGNGGNEFLPLARGLDVAGHEMTHGVVQNTANLVYENEPGALNESFADIFGAMIDRDDWTVGEDVVKLAVFPSGAMRSLQDPHNGAATGDFGNGWQPKKYSERYTGSQDNGGVHLNSGIPNHAYYLFANNAAVGRDKAEKVFYKALDDYMTMSSRFVDARVATIRAAKELYGDAVANAATAAWDAVEVTGTSTGNYQKEEAANPGIDLIVFTSAAKKKLYLYTADGQQVANPLSNKNPINKPSVSDDGTLIMFVGDDKKIQYIQLDYKAGTIKENTLNIPNLKWRNVAVSKDGTLISALTDSINNAMYIFDLVSGNGKRFKLYNPTFTQGVSTGDVLYSDAMEWDHTGEYVMYDAENSLKSKTAGSIEYWDIGFIKVWKKANKAFDAGKITKLFPALDEGESVGNPTFAKNSPSVIAFDYLVEGAAGAKEYAVLGANIEAGNIGSIVEKNNELGVPSYSKADNRVIYSSQSLNVFDLNITGVNNTKIQGDKTVKKFDTDAYWGVWFSNGVRVLSSFKHIDETALGSLELSPNPTQAMISVKTVSIKSQMVTYQIIDASGKVVSKGTRDMQQGENTWSLDVANLNQGMYLFKIQDNHSIIGSTKFIKM